MLPLRSDYVLAFSIRENLGRSCLFYSYGRSRVSLYTFTYLINRDTCLARRCPDISKNYFFCSGFSPNSPNTATKIYT